MIPKENKWLSHLGIVTAVAILLVVGCFTTLDMSSETEPSQIEKRVASAYLDLKVRLKSPTKTPPLKSTTEDLVIGSEIYRAQCSFCHGSVDGNPAPLAKSFSPRPPQFATDPSQRPAWMNAYLIRHGIRWTAMPAFADLPEADAWRVALFLEARAKSKERP